MIVNFEFIGDDPIENVITCMNFKVDKVVFFGYSETIQRQHKQVESFLKKYCGVQKTAFWPLSHNDFQSVFRTMRVEIEKEIEQNNDIYFDITGGESLILVAFGMLSKDFDTPMHQYDIPNNKLIELEEGSNRRISKEVPNQIVRFTIERYIEMYGGTINYELHKGIKEESKEFTNDIVKIWNVAQGNWEYWNLFSDFLRINMIPNDELQVVRRTSDVISALSGSNNKLKSISTFNEIVDELAGAGILQNVKHNDGQYRITFKNQNVKDCLWEGGSILELHTYQMQKSESDECKVGIHLDWDGVIHERPGTDVLNEIDVLSLKGNIMTFISCKSGKMGANQVLHALYELDTVTRRFGGKYAKKVLVTAEELGKVYLERAEEMHIEVKEY